MLFKNTDIAPVDCGGLMLPVGASADLDPTGPVVAEHVEYGRLTPVNTPPGKPSKTSKES